MIQPDFLNEVEKAAVQAFYENEGMRESVKKVLLASMYDQGTLKPGVPADPLQNLAFVFVSNNPDVKNDVIGENLRALWQGVNALVNGFNKLSEYKKVELKEPKPNKAR